jgi:RNA polymerase sigma-70 factor, ECF subfamily
VSHPARPLAGRGRLGYTSTWDRDTPAASGGGGVRGEGVPDVRRGGSPRPAVATEARTFDAFYAQHLPTVLASVIALRGPRVAAEELVQEAFVRAFRRWNEVSVMARPDLWVQRVALNLAASQLRRLAAEARALARSGARPTAGAETLSFEEAERFWQLVRRLPPQQARIVALHYAADRSVHDIAEVLGLAEGTVKAHLHKARTQLGELLEEVAP